jgi:WD40 repeat protein
LKLQTGKLLRKYRSESGSVSAVTFSPDGQHVASASKASSILILDLANGTTRILRDVDPSEQIRHIAFSPNGKFLVGGSENGKIRIWNVNTGNVERSFAAHTAKIQGLEFNPDGTLLASASEDSTVKLWDVSNWTLRGTLIGHRSGVYEIAFSPDGKLLLSGSDDKTARLWDVASSKEIITPIQHNSPVWAVDFEPDGKLIATGSEDSTVQLWKLSSSGTATTLQDHFTFRVSDGPIWWLKFHSSDKQVYLGVASQDKTVRVFHMSGLAPLFSNLNHLELEAQDQGGLVIGQGLSGEPQIVPLKPEQFVSKK